MAIKSALFLVFGFLGDVASFLSFLEPVPKFYRVYNKKRTGDGLESIPYIAALFSAMLWLFYAYVKTGEMLLLVVNAFGCVVETIYLAIYITYCPKKARMPTLRLILLLNFGVFCVIVLLTHLLAKEAAARVKLLGWICMAFATSAGDVVAPISIIREVIRKKSLELLSHSIMLLVKAIAAIKGLFYGLAFKDFYVTLPNTVRVSFGIVQMVLYAKYRKNKPVEDEKLPEHKGEVTNENKGEVINENKNDRHDQEKHETVTIEMGDQKKKLDEEEEEKPQEGEEKEQPPQNWQDQRTKVSEIPPQKMVVDDQTRLNILESLEFFF
ncbi:hypothetical protein QN277_025708 [Acacia crassicarpa]|uniref:Bidirectional sugar transporter SWEET n=1 Tax=Acacia crassicarpa TaxID=499986 RepID=A0AAE1MGK8_9FABA|nr:hypothetical protein QN277_025708 [Acacia crassicarpa]